MSESVPVQVQFGTQLVSHRSGVLSAELANNLYMEQAPQGAKSNITLLGTPGLKRFSVVDATGPIRGMLEFDNYLFVVAGTTLYKIQSSGSAFAIGPVPGVGFVQMATNGSYIWLCNTLGSLYAADGSSIIDLSSDIGAPIGSVTAQDGYNIAAESGTNRWHLSGLDALGNTVSGLFTTTDALPGNMVSILSDHGEVLAFKTTSIETYQNTGAAAFPFQRTQLIEQGCIAPASVAKYKNSVFWLGDDLQVYSMSGYQPQPIATDSVAYLIEQNASPSSVVGWTYQQAGHAFYALRFSDFTAVYDIDTGVWHKRSSQKYDGTWKASYGVYISGWQKHIVGDGLNGNLYELDLDTYDEDGEDLVREAIGTPVWNNTKRFIVDEFTLDIETGVGIQNSRETAWAASTAYVVGELVSNYGNVYRCATAGTSVGTWNGPTGTGAGIKYSAATVISWDFVQEEDRGETPEVILDWTDDGGKTWSSRLTRSIGKIGERKTAVVFSRLGAHRNVAFRVRISEPVPVRINGAYIRVDMLNA